MLERDKDEQWAEALSLWVDQKAAAYLKENHSRFETALEEQRRLAEKYPGIIPFLDGEGAMELTAEEHQAIKEYLNLREKAEFLIREYRYYLGQTMYIPGGRNLRSIKMCSGGQEKTGQAGFWSFWPQTRWRKLTRCFVPPIRNTG